MNIKRVAIAPNPRKMWARRVARELHSFLRERGVHVTRACEHADLLITIGGDGTILHEKKQCNAPVFGIGSETSFICQAMCRNWRKVLAAALARPRIEERLMIASTLNGKRMEDALNEVFVRNWNHRVLDFDLAVANRGRRRTYNFRADGVIFSTPTGSSAYAYSAGGAELPYTVRKYEIVGLAPYRRAFKPLVVLDSAVAKLIIRTERPAFAVIDGQFSHPLRKGRNVLVVKRSAVPMRLLVSGGR